MDVFSDYDSGILSDLFSNVSGNWCYTYDSCMFEYVRQFQCSDVQCHIDGSVIYNDAW